MGYTTEFEGSLKFNKKVDKKMEKYINEFSDTRHMKRDVDKIKEFYPNWKELGFDGELGDEGEYLLVDEKWDDASIIDYNEPGGSAPGLWCQWIIKDGKLQWDRGEKFYNYINWLEYLIKNFFAPHGYILNGSIDWQGEDDDDKGTIVVKDSKIYEIYR